MRRLIVLALFATACSVAVDPPAESISPVLATAPPCTPVPQCTAPYFDGPACIDVPGESGGFDRRVCVMPDGTEWQRPDVDKGFAMHYVPVENTRHAPAYELCEVLIATGAVLWRAPPGYVGTGAGSTE